MTQRTIASSGLTSIDRFPCLARRRSTVGASRYSARPRRALPALDTSPTPPSAITPTTPPRAELLRALGPARPTADQHALELIANAASQALLRHRIDWT